ncbi:heavy metal-binding domain-containing protein [Hymenobacter persicinus]|uniref:Heavy metal binding domain-containing protein n=1 Tax=Hymenobacter persicinus TaxID=2025506 RepID=A0A4Q5LF45_9BACT|nr:heavy metal-binding domain-containing protein [Hymenobacter persicinus]RYU83329.1 hypothetical protein EWM57_03315 [Hymenobacter persicinus]
MKNLTPGFLLVLFALSLTLLTGCNSAPATQEAKTTSATPAAAPAAQATSVCPMGCEGSESTKPGQCPVCGMDLEKKS